MASLQPVLLVAVSVREETSSRCPAHQPKLLPDDAGYVVAAFVAFPMPSVLPRHYWMFHSIWHVLLAAGQSALLWQLAPISNVPMQCNADHMVCNRGLMSLLAVCLVQLRAETSPERDPHASMQPSICCMLPSVASRERLLAAAHALTAS